MDEAVREKFESYPVNARVRLSEIRKLIFELAIEEGVGEISESLKWGEPSYASKGGSPIRLGWKAINPDTVSIYFNCKTTLVETFREVYKSTFEYAGNREILFATSDPMPLDQLKACITMALKYHKIKHLPLLGA